jgi:dTDP-4-dehydrorhamnose reductase
MRVLLTGAGGLLGNEFLEALAGHDVITAGRAELDPANEANIEALIIQSKADILINCAAYTDVEGAERDPAPDRAANAALPALLAKYCGEQNMLLVHFSSTGCYGNWKDGPYVETDDLRPTTAYHGSKAEGEAAITASGCEFVIFRTGWLYGGAPGQAKNFVWKRLVEGFSAPDMVSDATQFGCPTATTDVVRNALAAIEAGARGVFNLVAHGSASRYDYVAAILAFADLPCRVTPGPGFKRLAAVSPNETAANAALQSNGLDFMQDWRVSLRDYVTGITASADWHNLTGSR